MDTTEYTVAYWNAHTDPTNPDRWHALYVAAGDLGLAAREAGDKDTATHWFDTGRAAHRHYRIARKGVSPLSDKGRAMVDRLESIGA